MKMMKRTISLALLLALLLSLAACGGGGDTSTTAPEGTANDATGTPATDDSSAVEAPADSGELKVLTYGADANSTTFDPVSDMQTKSGNFFLQAAGETLWKMDEDGNMTYLLAENVEWTDDLTLTITLRDGISFHNGNPLTADDVLFTLEHLGSSVRTQDMLIRLDFDSTSVVDDLTIDIVFTEYDNGLIDALGHASYCILDRETCEADPSFGWFVGTGPYRLAGDGTSDTSGWVESVHYYLVRNENYWGGAPYYDEIYCKFYSEESTRYSDLMAGNLDAAIFSQATYVNNLKNGAVADAHLVQLELNSVFGFTMNSEFDNRPLEDINVRKAVAHALDIPTMVESLGEGIYNVASSIVGEGSWAHTDVGAYEYNPELAKEYLTQAGYSTENPVTLYMVAESTAFQLALAEAAQSYLAEIGINLDISGMADFGTILPRLLENDLDMAVNGPTNQAGNDPANLLQQMSPASIGILSVYNPEAAELFNSGITERDQSKRIEIYKKFQQINYDDCFFIPVWVETFNYGVSNSITSFESAIDSNQTINPCLLTD